MSKPDVELIALGREFEKTAAALDDAIEHKRDVTDELLQTLGLIESKILSVPAKSIEGFRVKARAACWARLGDLDPTGETTTDKRMGLSIVRDLIRLWDPRLERPGALAQLADHSDFLSAPPTLVPSIRQHPFGPPDQV